MTIWGNVFGFASVLVLAVLVAWLFPDLALLLGIAGLALAEAFGARSFRRPRSSVPAAPSRLAPAYSAGRGCAPGCCPICGMDDPQGLEPCWGGLEAHRDCAEYLGYGPQTLGITMAEASANIGAVLAYLEGRE